MSLILDALNKADNEENQTEVPTYASDHDFGPESSLPSNDNRRFYLILALCAIFATVITIVLMMSLSKDKERAQQEKSLAPQTQSAANQQNNAPSALNQKPSAFNQEPSALTKEQPSTSSNQPSSTNEKLSVAEQWQNTGPVVTKSRPQSTLSKPTKLSSIKKPQTTTPTSNNQATNEGSSFTQQTAASNSNTEEEKRKALIAEQYQKAIQDQKSTQNQKTAQDTAQQNLNAASSNEQVKQTKVNSAAIDAIYQNIEKEDNSQALARAEEKNPTSTQSAKTKPRVNPYMNDAPAKTTQPSTSISAPKAENTLAKYPNLNFIHDLPFSSQNKIPTIMYTAHNYADRSSTVTLNKKQCRVGEKITGGLTLDEILEDGIVLTFNSTRFKMKALNSWINM